MDLFKKAKALTIQAAFSKWPDFAGNPSHGYTLLLPVPADLPIFTQLALENISRQDLTHLNEMLIIPDMASRDFLRILKGFDVSRLPPLKIVKMRAIARLIGFISKSANTYHSFQLISGVMASQSSHVLFHDADLFMAPGGFLRQRFEYCAAKHLSILAIHPRRNRYTEDCRHLVATWEMIATQDWFRRFKPYQLRGQSAKINHKEISFDTTHLAQYLSRPDEIEYQSPAERFVHFGYIITTYRRFQKGPRPYNDLWFKLLFIRLLIDTAVQHEWHYRLPLYKDFIEGLTGSNKYVTYATPDNAKEYLTFRRELQQLLDLGCFDQRMMEGINEKILPFDEHFKWNARALSAKNDKLPAMPG